MYRVIDHRVDPSTLHGPFASGIEIENVDGRSHLFIAAVLGAVDELRQGGAP
jgi:hypothetical protein